MVFRILMALILKFSGALIITIPVWTKKVFSLLTLFIGIMDTLFISKDTIPSLCRLLYFVTSPVWTKNKSILFFYRIDFILVIEDNIYFYGYLLCLYLMGLVVFSNRASLMTWDIQHPCSHHAVNITIYLANTRAQHNNQQPTKINDDDDDHDDDDGRCNVLCVCLIM